MAANRNAFTAELQRKLILDAIPLIRDQWGACTYTLLQRYINIPRGTLYRRVRTLRREGLLEAGPSGSIRLSEHTSQSKSAQGTG